MLFVNRTTCVDRSYGRGTWMAASPWRAFTFLCVAFLVGMLPACNAATPSNGEQHTVDRVVRRYIDLRNHGDLNGLLSLSCGQLYSSARNLLRLPDQRRRIVIASMRQHPATVQHVTIDHIQHFRFEATLTASAHTARGQQTGSQHVTIREYRKGYRVCKMNP